MLIEDVVLVQGMDAQQPAVPISGHPFKEIHIPGISHAAEKQTRTSGLA